MKEAEARALFLLAGIEVKSIHELANKYWPMTEGYRSAREKDPWWLVQTHFGLIEIGWRKRVISIDWSNTELRIILTKDQVTKEINMVHAWSYAKAVEYLTSLRQGFVDLEALKKDTSSVTDG